MTRRLTAVCKSAALSALVLTVSLLGGCSLPLPGVEPVPAETPLTSPTAEPAPAGPTISFEGVSFVLDPAIAAAASGVAEPDTSDPSVPPEFDKGPARIAFRFDGYTGPTHTLPALVYVYNLADLTGKPEEVVASSLATLLQERPELAGQQQLPFLPVLNAGQGLHAREAYRDFANGSGIEYITLYAQDASPLTADRLWYTFQGMTDDGQRVVSVILPLTTDLFPAQLPADFDDEEWFAGYDQYIADSRQALADAPVDRFAPQIDRLAALVRSIAVATGAAVEADAQGTAGTQGSSFAGTYTATLPAADTPGRAISLTLGLDGSASLSTDYLNGEPAIVETGTWQDNGDGSITVTFTQVGGFELAMPDIITFSRQGTQLVATVYDLEAYGTEGMTLHQGGEPVAGAPTPVQTAAPVETMAPAETPAPAEETAPIQPTAPAQPVAANEIAGVTWQLQEIRRGNSLSTQVDDPSKYTLDLRANGDVAIVVDCNTGTGVYQVVGDTIRFQRLATTRAACPPSSLSSQFTKVLEFVDRYAIENGNLLLEYGNGAGTLRFAPATQ